jgi:hypothetical protein
MVELAAAGWEGVASSSGVGLHEIQGAIVKINAVADGDGEVAAGSAVSGRVTSVAVDPSDAVMEAVKSSAVTDLAAGGDTAQGTALPSVTDLVIDPFSADRCYFLIGLATGDGDDAASMLDSRPGAGVLKSLDGGRTWSSEAETFVSSPPPVAPSAKPLPVLLVIANRDF